MINDGIFIFGRTIPLTSRTQVVKINNTLSDPKITHTGAPQGCVSSPVLFTLYTNDCISSNTRNYIFKLSDDTAILSLLYKDSDLSFYHSEIKTFEQWCDASKLILNVKKTEEIVFDPRAVGVHSPVVIYNTQIKQVCSNKYLGIYIDNMFTWQIHVDNLCAKLQQRLYFLRRLRLYGVNKKIRTVFYQAVLESLIRYGIQAWYGNLSVQLKNKLSHIVRMAMKIVDLKDYPSLKTLFEQSVHRGAHKILADPSHILQPEYVLLPSGRRYRSIQPVQKLFCACFY